ncbi:curlin repeat-containing protein [Pseudaminobacter sp. 19-2017]|uniref:Curlin repeat-containing protein n=1 Tax=Pseudaminobacter soli (ex Zhang et al. 2022) TaxID=2831468 RepID=A0A942E0I5_9HYPH|nr:curlin repeat-containing protein [Pseudaminobacter soli]MBS3651494.1 curlin repeat-containing protein [Pseudaminobacter soli]
MKLALATATAMGLLMGAAWAGSSNTLYLEQNGANNTASVHQATGPGGNDIGTSGDPVSQTGDNNAFVFSNAGCCNEGLRQDNDVAKAEQVGHRNWLNIQVWNLSDHNDINNVQQQGNDNALQLDQNGSRSSTIGTVLQEGDRNTSLIRQNGARNSVVSATIVGSDNGTARSGELSSGRSAGSRIIQSGNDNVITESRIEGSNNKQATNTYAPPHDIQQYGSNNGHNASIARTLGSNGNGIKVTQRGDWNNFSIQQGVDANSAGNYATLTQDGSFNAAYVTQSGSNNHIIVDQDRNSNTATANFTGSGNGVGTLTGVAGALDTQHASLTQGTIFQDSGLAMSGNTVTYNVTGSNNLFAFAQLGGSNTINGTVGSSGVSNANQVAVIQTGSSNNSTFTQNGGSNNLAVSQ